MQEERGGTWSTDTTYLLSGHFSDVNNASTVYIQPLLMIMCCFFKVTVRDTLKGEVRAIKCSDCTAAGLCTNNGTEH